MNLSFFFFVLLPFGSLSPKFTFTMSDTNEVSVEFEKTENGVEEMVEEKLSVFEKLIPGLVDKLVDDNAKHIELPPRPSPAQIAAASGSSSTSTSSASVNPLPILPVGRETMAFQVCLGSFSFEHSFRSFRLISFFISASLSITPL